jgi:hypothetical protein
MATKNETRLYSMADADLKQLADNLKDSIVRDLTDFNTRNITTTKVAAFEALIDSFNNSSTDEELQGALNVEVIAKDALAEGIRKAIRPIRNMAELAYNSTGKYKIFGFEDMAILSDNDLQRMAKRVARVGNSLLTELQDQGLTTVQLTTLETLANDLDKAIDKVGAANENRDLQTQQRVTLGNTLWKEMSTLASIGQSLFADTNEAKYNDYVLVGGTATTPVAAVPVVTT